MGQALSLMDRREEASASLHEAVRLAPDDLLKNWLSFGAGAQEQFRKLLSSMTDLAKKPSSGS